MLIWFVLGIFVVNCNGFHLSEILQIFEGDDEILSDLADKFATKFENEYLKYQNSNVESANLRLLTDKLAELHSGEVKLLSTSAAKFGVVDQFFACTTCRATVSVVLGIFRNPAMTGPNKQKATKALIVFFCKSLSKQNDAVCSALFDLNWPYLEYIMKNSKIDARSLCGMLPISSCKIQQTEFNFKLNIDNNDKRPLGEKSERPIKGDNDLVVLHLTDIHFDPLYTPGALAECGEPLCCHKENTAGPSKAAGYWGDYRDCDSPWHMINDAFSHINLTHKKIDMIYHTGDIVDHMIWDTSKEKNNQTITKVNDFLKESFPGIPVYSSVGNHEPSPLNLFSPPDAPEDLNVKWLYEILNNLWRKWLPSDTEKTIKLGGYYTITPKPGFRIISMNNNECNIVNWWIYYNGSYLIPQLEWLHDTLLAAEKANEYVHILAHIPSGDSDCWPVWAREFNRIVERFRYTISGIFNGHTHFDELNVHYTTNNYAVAVSWNGGSLTTFSKTNPNYKIFHLTPKTMEVTDFETWTFNLTDANKYGAAKTPEWFKEYVFSEEFTDDLSPAGMNKLLEKMADNPELLRKFWRFKYTAAEPRMAEGCDGKCMSKLICDLSTTVSDQKDRCKELQTKLATSLAKEKSEPSKPLPT